MKNLLDPGNFKLIHNNNKNYVFLTESLQILHITTPAMESYFDLCQGKKGPVPLEGREVCTITEKINEIRRIPAVQEVNKQQMLILNTTHGCNMACKYCFASTKEEKQSVMTLSTVAKSVTNMVNNNPEAEVYTVYFFGGEPLLHKRFVEDAVKIVREEIEGKRKKKVNFLLNTNGTLLTLPFIRFMKKENFVVTVSIDGPRDYHDVNRGFFNGKGSFARIMKGIELLKKEEVCFNLRATFNPRVENLIEIFRFFESLEVPYSYAFAINSKEKESEETKFEDKDIERMDGELREVMDYLVEKIRSQEKVYCSSFLQNMVRIKHRQMRRYGCEAGRASLIVDEEGNYYACQNMLPFRETAVGDISNGIDLLSLHQYQSKDLSALSVCQKCWARYLCGGGCEAERYFPETNSGNFSQRCKLSQLEWNHFINAYIRLN